jgi:hypothetical protein
VDGERGVATSGPPPRSRPSKPKIRHTDLNVLLEEQVFPALFDVLGTAFPEFGFSRSGDAWTASTWPTGLDWPQHQHPDRLVCYENTCFGFMVHGHQLIPWLAWINGGTFPKGQDFDDCVRDLCGRSGVLFPARKVSDQELDESKQWEERRVMLDEVAVIGHADLMADTPDAIRAREYLAGRGLPEAALRDLQIGLYRGVGWVEGKLKGPKCVADESALLSGALTDYIIFPWHDANGTVMTLYGRWPGGELPEMRAHVGSSWKRDRKYQAWSNLSAEKKTENPWVEERIPKTVALPGASTKSSPLYFDRARKARHAHIVAVEGVLDAAVLQSLGDTRTVAYVAASFSVGQIDTLVRHRIESVTIVSDPDGGGDKGACDSIDRLLAAGIRVYVAPRLPDGLDPDEFVLSRGIEAWRDHVSRAVPGAVHRAGVVLGDVTPESTEIDRRGAVARVAEYARGLADPLDRDAVARLAAERTGYPAEVVGEAVGGTGADRAAADPHSDAVPPQAPGGTYDLPTERLKPRPLTLIPDETPVKALDRGNFGTTVGDSPGNMIRVHFENREKGTEYDKTFHRSQLSHPNGDPLDGALTPADLAARLDADKVRGRASEVIAAGDVAGLYNDDDLIDALAKLRAAGSPAFAIVRSLIAESKKFPTGDFDRTIKERGREYTPARGSKSKEAGTPTPYYLTPEVGSDATEGREYTDEDGEQDALEHAEWMVGVESANKGAGKPGRLVVDTPPPEYRMQDGFTIASLVNRDGDRIAELIARFEAKIAESVVRDDGTTELVRTFKIEARSFRRPQAVRTVEVSAEKFARMEWVVPALGPDFSIVSGQGFRDHMRSAIQELSPDHAETTIYTHTGWRQIDGQWRYLHEGGAIGTAGNDPSIRVEAPGLAGKFRLPDPPEGDRLKRAVRASLGMLKLGSKDRPGSLAAAAVLFTSTYRAPIRHATFVVQVHGPTGTFKTSTFALAQQHFDARMDGSNLPASWASDTPKAIGQMLSRVGDAVAIIDDSIPRGNSQTIARKQSEVQDLFQMVGNHTGRQRLKQDGSERPSRPPGCLVISTAEDRVAGGSADFRSLPLHFAPGMIDAKELAARQKDAAAGLLAESMAGYVRWLAPQLDAVRAEMDARVLVLRDELGAVEDHKRLPEILANLTFGAEIALRFALEVGAIDEAERDARMEEVRAGLAEAAGAIREDRAEQLDPCQTFLQLVRAAMSGGRAFLSGALNDGQPCGRESLCGWHGGLRPTSAHLGWIDDDHAYILPDVAYAVVRRMADDLGEGFVTSQRGLGVMLKEAGLVEGSKDANGKVRSTTRFTPGVGKSQIRVYKVPVGRLWEADDRPRSPQPSPLAP